MVKVIHFSRGSMTAYKFYDYSSAICLHFKLIFFSHFSLIFVNQCEGEYLGLTGGRLNGNEMLACGLATHLVLSKVLSLKDRFK